MMDLSFWLMFGAFLLAMLGWWRSKRELNRLRQLASALQNSRKLQEVRPDVWRPRYYVLDEHRQIIALTQTRWTAGKLIEGIKADVDSPTSRLGSWSVERIDANG
jgi:hypothetical protein